MKKYFLFIAGFRFADHVLLILCLSCMSACSGSFDKAYDAQTKGKTGQAFFDGLVRLDQTYPNKLALKLEIVFPARDSFLFLPQLARVA